jgi:hypothetical protein
MLTVLAAGMASRSQFTWRWRDGARETAPSVLVRTARASAGRVKALTVRVATHRVIPAHPPRAANGRARAGSPLPLPT